MVAQSGQDVLIKIDINKQGNYQTVAGMRSTKISFNSQAIDTTNMQSQGRWRELLEGGGIKTASLSGLGIFLDENSDAIMREAFFAGSHIQSQIILPDFGTIEGCFQLTALEYSGKYDGEVQFDVSFQSAGEIAFLPLIEETQ